MIVNILRCIGVYLYVLFSFFFSYITIKINNLFNWKLTKEKRRIQNIKIFYNISYYLFQLLFWINISIEGELVDISKKQYIIVCNHVSYFDLFVISNIIRKIPNYTNICFIGMGSLLNYPIAGYVLQQIDMIPVYFSKPKNFTVNRYDKISVKKAVEKVNIALQEGKSLVIFPEGKTNPNPQKMNMIRGGAYNFSKEFNIPIKIFGLKNVEKIWRRFSYPIGKGNIIIKIFNGEYNFKTIKEYRKTISNIIESYLLN